MKVVSALFLTIGLFSQVASAEETKSGGVGQAAATAAAQRDTFPEDPRRQIWYRHLQPLPKDIKTAGLHIDVYEAPSMAARITELFRSAGYNMVAPDQAVYRYELRGTFQSDRHLKMVLPLGSAFEGAVLGSHANASVLKLTSDVLAAGVLSNQALKSGLTTPVWAYGDLLKAVLEATGLRDSVNTALAGDRRGWCIGGCTYWEWSDQRVGLGWRDPRLKRLEGMSSVDVGVFAKGVFIEELTTLALNEFLRHHGVITAVEPPTDAIMPTDQLPGILQGRVKATIRMLEP